MSNKVKELDAHREELLRFIKNTEAIINRLERKLINEGSKNQKDK